MTKIERRRTHDDESDNDEEEVRSYPENECEMVDVGDLVKNAKAKIQDPELSLRSCDSVMSADDNEKSDTTTSSAPEKEPNSSPDVTLDTTEEIDEKLQEMESELMRRILAPNPTKANEPNADGTSKGEVGTSVTNPVNNQGKKGDLLDLKIRHSSKISFSMIILLKNLRFRQA